MKPYTEYILLLLITLFTVINLKSQDAQFSQYYAAKFNIAPSFAGSNQGGRLTSIFRDQWPMLKGTYITYGFAIDHSISQLNSGVGVYALQDYSNGGAYVVTNIGVQYSYAVKLNNYWQFRPGLQVNGINRKLHLDDLVFGNQLSFNGTNNDQNLNIESNNITAYESAVSLLFNSDKIWVGASLSNMSLSKRSFTGESHRHNPVKFVSFGGARLKTIQGRLMYDKDYFYFSYLFKYQNNFKQFDLGASWSNEKLVLGLWYRGLPFIKNSSGEFNNSALIIKTGMRFKNHSIGYSFDYSLNKISSFTGGAHEISLVFLFNQGTVVKRKNHRMVPSPRF